MRIFSFILNVARTQSRGLILTAVLLAVSGLLQIGATLALARLVRQSLRNSDSEFDWLSLALSDGIWFLGFALASVFLIRLANQKFSNISGALRTSAALVFCDHLYGQPKQFYIDHSGGKLGYLTESASMRLQVIVQIFVFEIWPAIVTVLVAGSILFLTHVGLATAIFLWALVYFFMTLYLSSKRRGLDTHAEKTNTIAVSDMSDTLNKRELVNLFVQFEKEAKRVRNITSLVSKYRLKFTLQSEKARIFQFGMATFIRVAMVGLVATLVLVDDLGAEGFVLTVFLTGLIIVYVQKSAERVHILLLFWATLANALEEIMQPHSIVFLTQSPQAVPSCPDINFNGISMSYHEGQSVLKNLSLDIPFGQNIAIVGGSGSGKTTLTSLLVRDYDPVEGSISIGETPIRDLPRETLAAVCAVVPQANELWGSSIAENLKYGRPSVTQVEIEQAAERTGCHEFIMDTPQGYETELGADGEGLSGGQIQRLAIARAVLRDSPIMILDEPSSGLDAITEADLLSSLLPYTKQKTLIVVTHHLSIAQKMDRVIVMKEGQIVEDGHHETLMSQQGAYAELWAARSLKRSDVKSRSITSSEVSK